MIVEDRIVVSNCFYCYSLFLFKLMCHVGSLILMISINFLCLFLIISYNCLKFLVLNFKIIYELFKPNFFSFTCWDHILCHILLILQLSPFFIYPLFKSHCLFLKVFDWTRRFVRKLQEAVVLNKEEWVKTFHHRLYRLYKRWFKRWYLLI